MVLSLVCSTRAIRGVPIFPARTVEKPAFFKICSIREVVVVFPFEPVIPIKRPCRKRSASSTSLQMVTPFARASCNNGASAGTPGLGTIKSCSRNVISRWPPSSRFTPAVRSGAIISPISFSVRASVAVTFAPRVAQNSAVATPVLASPTTSTRLPRNSNGFAIYLAKPANQNDFLPQFQRRQRKQRKNQRGDPKPHDHFRFAPTEQFEMVMDGRHAEDALAAQFERTYLQNHGKSFNDEDTADEKEQDFLLDDDSDGAQCSSERQRANIAHEDFRGMRVVPEKPERSPHERPAEYGKFADARNVLNLEISGPAVVAAHVGQNRKRPRRDDRTADCQPIQPIRQVHRVGGTDNDDGRSHQEGHERQRPEVPGKMRFVEQRVNHQIGMESLQKRKDELRRVSTVGGQDKKHDANNQADESLKINFLLRGETQIALIRDFRVIIDEANHGKTE